jgi:hypothetical protein
MKRYKMSQNVSEDCIKNLYGTQRVSLLFLYSDIVKIERATSYCVVYRWQIKVE